MQHDKREARLNKRTIQRINTEVQYTHCTETPRGTRRQRGHTKGTPVVHTFYKNLGAIRVAWSHNSVVTCQPQGYLVLSVRCTRTDTHLCLTTRKLQQLHSKHVAPPNTAYVQPWIQHLQTKKYTGTYSDLHWYTGTYSDLHWYTAT